MQNKIEIFEVFMNFAIINGSPKGNFSITLQSVLYLQKKFPEHQYNILNVGQSIKALEKDFSKAKEIIEKSDVILFSYPVYTFLAPSQLHKFIELLKINKINLKGKIATQITTSKHFYDITAHKYIQENAQDLELNYIRGLSADMEDLLTEKGQKDLEKCFERLLWSINEKIYEPQSFFYSQNQLEQATVPTEEVFNQDKSKDIVIITDCSTEENSETDSNLQKMILRFQKKFNYATRIVNLKDFPFSGGCLGCFRCAVSEKCVHKDGFDTFLRENIQKADGIIYAFSIKDHSMGPIFKMYDDRNFCNGHRTVTVGMPVGYIVSGNYSFENNLKTVIEARAETGGNFLCAVATDEKNTDEQIDNLAKSFEFALNTHHTTPQNFWGVGGMKIFRDLIYQMRGMMRADHKFYKKQGIYDFPQKKKLTSLKMYLVGSLLSNQKILSKMGNKMNEGMLLPYKKLFQKMEKNE